MQMYVHKTTIFTPQRKRPMLEQKSQTRASLAAIARYIQVIYTRGLPQSFPNKVLLSKKHCHGPNETANDDLTNKAFQRHLETRAGNVWDLVQSNQSPFQ